MSDISQDDVDLNYYEGIRKGLVKKVVEKGIPTDPEMAGLLLKALDGGSRTILAKKRLEVDKESNENMAAHQTLIAEVLRSSPTARQARERTEVLPVIETAAPMDGEATVGTKEVRYNDIMSKN